MELPDDSGRFLLNPRGLMWGEAITFGGTIGPFSLVHTPHSWPVPWFDEHGGLSPVFHARVVFVLDAERFFDAASTPTRTCATA